MKRFRVVALGPESNNFAWLHTDHMEATAALAGWDSAATGRRVLRKLKVGDRAIDVDGDTWERIA